MFLFFSPYQIHGISTEYDYKNCPTQTAMFYFSHSSVFAFSPERKKITVFLRYLGLRWMWWGGALKTAERSEKAWERLLKTHLTHPIPSPHPYPVALALCSTETAKNLPSICTLCFPPKLFSNVSKNHQGVPIKDHLHTKNITLLIMRGLASPWVFKKGR